MTSYIRYDKKNDELYLREFIAQGFEGKQGDVPFMRHKYDFFEDAPTRVLREFFAEDYYEIFCVDVSRNDRLTIGYFRDDPTVTFFTCDKNDDKLYFLSKEEWIEQAVVALGMEKILNREDRISEYIDETMETLEL
jgi:hypothetical protein